MDNKDDSNGCYKGAGEDNEVQVVEELTGQLDRIQGKLMEAFRKHHQKKKEQGYYNNFGRNKKGEHHMVVERRNKMALKMRFTMARKCLMEGCEEFRRGNKEEGLRSTVDGMVLTWYVLHLDRTLPANKLRSVVVVTQ